MADVLAAWNMAVGRLGEPYTITDQAEDSLPARECRKEWDNARRAVLRHGKFNFSISRAQLAAQAATDPNYVPPFPYTARFPIPPTCLRVIEVYDAAGCLLSHYRDEAGAILTNAAGPLTLVHVADVPSIGAWDDLSLQALVARLAFAIADAIIGDQSRKNGCWNEFRQLTRDTTGVDAKEDPPVEPYDSSWVTSRFSGGRFGGPPNVWRG